MTKKTITISPVTRIEGHAKITLNLDSKGEVQEAFFHVDEFRGFEKFCEGRHFSEMPVMTARICGICPVSHAVSSAKAGERIMKVRAPYTGELLRRLIHLGQTISSHALSFFHLSSPDLLLGWDADPEKRNILGLAEKFPDLALRGIRLRKFGQEISERICGKKIHVSGIAAGGMNYPLTEENLKALLEWVPEAMETTRMGLDIFKKYRDANLEEVDSFAAFETLYLGTVDPEGASDLYDGKLRFVDASGKVVSDQLDPADYLDYIAEECVPWSYLKYPFYKPYGPQKGVYRVGPLARLNVASKMKTPLAQKEFVEYRQLARELPSHGSFYYHYARLIEMLGAIEQVKEVLEDPKILSDDILSTAGRNQAEGVGSTEAPRGTLFHHYITDEGGALLKVNLLIATGQNNPAMNRSVLEVAKAYVKGADVKEGALNRVEGAIRCYDPCLSCSTHALGAMPLLIEIKDSKNRLLRSIRRNSG